MDCGFPNKPKVDIFKRQRLMELLLEWKEHRDAPDLYAMVDAIVELFEEE